MTASCNAQFTLGAPVHKPVDSVTVPEEQARGRYCGEMANKSRPTGEAKKPGRTLKEKRQAKHAKQAAQKQARKAWETK